MADAWQPATELERRMDAALYSGCQEAYFRLLADAEFVIPIAPELIEAVLADQARLTWPVGTEDGRTHVHVYTSAQAMQACLGDRYQHFLTLTFREIADAWPDPRWWLVIDPGLPIQGHLPAWFVRQILEGDPLPPLAGMTRPPAVQGPAAGDAVAVPTAQAVAAAPVATAPAGSIPAGATPAGATPAGTDAAGRPAMPAVPAVPSVPSGPGASGPQGVGSQAAGPQGPGPHGTGPQPAFEPANDVERALLGAIGAGDENAFIQILAGAEAVVPIPPDMDYTLRPGRPGFPWQTREIDGRTVLPVFTSPERMRDAMGAPSPAAPLPGVGDFMKFPVITVLRYWPDAALDLVVNPGGPVAGTVPGARMTALSEWADQQKIRQMAEGFEPQNELEQRLFEAAVRNDPDAFLQILLGAQVLVPSEPDTPWGIKPDEAEFPWHAVPVQGRPSVQLFTSLKWMHEAIGSSRFVMPGFAEIVSAWPETGWTLILNPGTPVSTVLHGEQIRALGIPSAASAAEPVPSPGTVPPADAVPPTDTVPPTGAVPPAGSAPPAEHAQAAEPTTPAAPDAPTAPAVPAVPASTTAPATAASNGASVSKPSIADLLGGSPPASREQADLAAATADPAETSLDLRPITDLPPDAEPVGEAAAGPAGPATTAVPDVADAPSAPNSPNAPNAPNAADVPGIADVPGVADTADAPPAGEPAAPPVPEAPPAAASAPAHEPVRSQASGEAPGTPITEPPAEFEPGNRIDQDLYEAAVTGDTDAFLRVLLRANVLVPAAEDAPLEITPAQPEFRWDAALRDQDTVQVFTSLLRLREKLGQGLDEAQPPPRFVYIDFKELIACWPRADWDMALNPTARIGASLEGGQIRALSEWAARVGLIEPPAAARQEATAITAEAAAPAAHRVNGRQADHDRAEAPSVPGVPGVPAGAGPGAGAGVGVGAAATDGPARMGADHEPELAGAAAGPYAAPHPDMQPDGHVDPQAEPPAEPGDGEAGPVSPTVLQKVVPPAHVGWYLEQGYDRVGGFVHPAADVSDLQTPVQLYQALGLFYEDSPFSPDDEGVYVIRWPAYCEQIYRIPFGGQSEDDLRPWGDAGWVVERAPFAGNGFAAGSAGTIREFKVDSARLPYGAEMYYLGSDRSERFIAVYDPDRLAWLRPEAAVADPGGVIAGETGGPGRTEAAQ